MRMQLVLDRPETAATETLAPDDVVEADAVDSNTETFRPFHSVIMLTETWTGDERIFMDVSWRDLPLPVMAQDWTDAEHMNAMLVGRIDRVELQGNEVHGWGVWLNTPEADRFYKLVNDGFLRGVSADLDDIEAELVIPGEVIDKQNEAMETMYGEDQEPGTEDDPDAPTPDVVIPLGGEQLRVLHARLMGMTILPFPALQEAFIENEAITAALFVSLADPPAGVTGWIDCDCDTEFKETSGTITTIVARAARPYDFNPPLAPPRAWMTTPGFDALTPLTITDEGRVYGHLAGWGSCHIGFADRCVTPPRSLTDYAHFHLGQVITAEGDRVACGKITFGVGHAPLSASAPAALAHYDNPKATVAAHVCAGEDDYGIWIAGGMMPGIAPETCRLIVGSDLSGDWRLIGNGLELVAALAVNVPGFHKTRPEVKMYQREGMLASLVASLPVIESRSGGIDPRLADALIERIARTVGRSTDQRIAAVSARVAKVRG